jgi:exodeoxyribonuclease VIII
MPIQKYHGAYSLPKWWSKTSLRYYQKHGPAWTKLWLDDQIQPHVPDGADVGLALDCYLTEGAATFAKRYPVVPAGAPKKPSKTQREAKKPSPETVEAIHWWDEFYAVYGFNCVILSHEDRTILTEAADAVRRLSCWKEIEESQAQMTVRREAAALGIGLQSRPDWLHLGRGRLRDLKKTRDLDIFGRQAIDLGYHLQAAVASWCLAGDQIAIEQASLVAVEWERGARAREFIIPHEALVAGDHDMRALAAEVADRIKRNDWTDQQEKAEMLPIPDYMMRKLEAKAEAA